jgi:hypothetical protein
LPAAGAPVEVVESGRSVGAVAPLPCCVVDAFVAAAPAFAVLFCEITSSPGLLIRMMTTMF